MKKSSSITITNDFKQFCIGFILSLDNQTLNTLKLSLPFYLEIYLERMILDIVGWAENDFYLMFLWLFFITLTSLCVKNEYGYNIEELHYIIFVISMGYCIYIYKHFYPRETKFIPIKLGIINFMLIQLFWSVFIYTWPYTNWIISFKELQNLFFFLWPDLNFTQWGR